jgi:adenylate cyclase
VKKGIGLPRDELEVKLTKKQFDLLWPATRGRRLEKFRYTLKWQAKKIEVDVYKKHLNGLRVAEVEFKSREEAAGFSPPEWFGKEVTNIKRYQNANLAERKKR